MALAKSLLPVVARARSVVGRLGFAEHSVSMVVGTWSGDYPGQGIESRESVPILEGEHNPAIKWLSDTALALSGLPVGSAEVGPLTPAHNGQGVEFSDLIGRQLQAGQTLFVIVKGPRHPTGSRYRISEAKYRGPLSYSIVIKPEK